MAKPAEVAVPVPEAYTLLTAIMLLKEFKNKWAWRMGACFDPECVICRDRRDFIARVDACLGKEPAGKLNDLVGKFNG